MNRISISLPNALYSVLIGKAVFRELEREIAVFNFPDNIFLIIDKNVYSFLKDRIEKFINLSYPNAKELLLTSDEKLKSYSSLQKIHGLLLKHRFNRNSLIIAIGGGIIGDLGGFASAVYMRGIDYINIPTTLLAAVDSSIGGKTGINFGETKNSIGAFHHPKLVLVDTDFLGTLPKEEIICGLGEVIKYAFLGEPDFYKYIYTNLNKALVLNQKVIEKIIIDSVKLKAGVVVQDEKEGGLRKILNFGHTFAHAFEVQQNHKIKHGQAVIAGITCALHLSHIKGLLPAEKLNDFLKIIYKMKKYVKLNRINYEKLYAIMRRDKKNRDGRIKFVLIKDIGEIIIDVDAEKKEIYSAIEKGTALFS